MKRKVIVLTFVVLAACLVVLGVALTRPAWLPAWARFGGAAPAEGKAEDTGLYCKEHGVPEKFCTLCHEELTRTLTLCKEHGNVPEDICTKCHPEVEKKYNIEMCPKGHGAPRYFCVDCGTIPSASATLPDDGWCVTHNKPEAECPECAKDPRKVGPVLAGDIPKVCRQPLPTVKLASAKLIRQVGIQTAEATEESHAHKLTANAEVAYDANRYAEISPRVGGFIRDVRVDLGQAVRQGDVLAVVDSSEVSAAKTQFISAQAALKLSQSASERVGSLARSGTLPGKMELEVMTTLNQAQAAAMDAEQKLRNLGFDDPRLIDILKSKDTRNLIDVVSPISGTVVLRHAVKGEAVQATTQLFAVADTAKVWIWIDVYEADIAKVASGQAVTFTVSGADPAGTDLPFLGKVTWVGTEVNQTTRTTRIRAELANPDGRLRSNQFGQAEVQIGSAHKAVFVPKSSVQRKDNANLVFVPMAEAGTYRAQRVVTRPTDRGDVVEVVWGLKPGERVVTKGAFLLKTEIMKASIGAGCCD